MYTGGRITFEVVKAVEILLWPEEASIYQNA